VQYGEVDARKPGIATATPAGTQGFAPQASSHRKTRKEEKVIMTIDKAVLRADAYRACSMKQTAGRKEIENIA